MSPRPAVGWSHAALLLLASCGGGGLPKGGDLQLAVQCDSLTVAFAASLKSELIAAVAEGGPVMAVEVCKTTAPVIAAEYSQRAGWQIRRVSSQNRNPANQPNEYEATVLERFAAGSVDQEYAWLTGADGDSTFVFMKAIRTTELCLTCHGPREQLDSTLAATLAREYPDDRATGYQANELRGAFVVTVRSPREP